MGSTRAHARRVVLVYLLLTLIGVAALLLAGAGLLDALVLGMTSVSTGGFSSRADSLASLPAAVVGVVNALCAAGAVSFHVYYASLLRPRGGRFLDNQFYGLLLLIVGGVATASLVSALTGSGIHLWDLLSLVVSAQTTAGFSTLPLASVPSWLLLLLCGSMFIGGGIGSTAGGIKIGRLLLAFGWTRSYFTRAGLVESAHTEMRFAGERVTEGDLEDLFAVLVAFIIVLMASWFVFVAHGYPPLAALFEVTSALATTGLSAGVTDAALPTLLKVVLCFDMLFGRVEVVALLILLLPRTWIGRRRTV